MTHYKKIAIIFILGVFFHAGIVYAQQITTVAIIDTSRVFIAFPTQSKGYENLNNLKERYQKEIDDRVAELDALKRERLLALNEKNFSKAGTLETKINNMANYIEALSKQRQSDLLRASQSPVSQNFLVKMQDAISFVAEAKGYTLVLQNTTDGIQWWAPVIDITDDVIARLREIL